QEPGKRELMPLTASKENAGSQEDQGQIDQPEAPVTQAQTGKIQKKDQGRFVIEDIPVWDAAAIQDPAGIPEHLLIIARDIERWTIKQGQQHAGCQEKKKGDISSVHHRIRNN